MKIAGWTKNSFLDFPGRISTVIFAPGCNMSCWYCHNAGIKDENIKFDEIIAYLKKRIGFIDGVVFSGGEATLQMDLADRIKEIKALGFQVKLDTNGTNPLIVKDLLNKKLLDYIAMDIKAPKDKYQQITRRIIDMKKIEESIKLIQNSGIEYEFRTTFSPDLHHEDIREIAKWIQGSRLYSIQQYRQQTHEGDLPEKPHNSEYVKQAGEIASVYVKTEIKGL